MYEFCFTTSDGRSTPYSETLELTVTDRLEAPTDVVLDPSTITEGNTVGVIGTLTTVDANTNDTHVYSLCRRGAINPDQSFFYIPDPRTQSLIFFGGRRGV